MGKPHGPEIGAGGEAGDILFVHGEFINRGVESDLAFTAAGHGDLEAGTPFKASGFQIKEEFRHSKIVDPYKSEPLFVVRLTDIVQILQIA